MEIVCLRILIAGDSFAAEWPGTHGWSKMLAEHHDVKNVAQAGVSEYKILKQLQNSKFDNYDIVIVSHTIHSRVHTNKHPIHKKGLHKDCDLIYSDIIDRSSLWNSSLHSAQGYFMHHYDDNYYQTIYKLLRKEIYTILADKKYLSISHHNIPKEFIFEDNHLSFNKIWQKNKGNENHYNNTGNKKVLKIILDKLLKL